MFKLPLLIGLFIFTTSCGQTSKPFVEKVETDSTTRSSDKSSKAKSTDTGNYKVKHEPYNKAIKNLPASLAQFVPEGYAALDTTSGDLNLDQFLDMIMILKKNGEDTTSDVVEDPEKRPLLILVGQSDHSYKLAARSDNAVYCIDCGGVMGDPFMEIAIKKGYFSVEHYGGSGWRWTRTITFKYSPADNNWYLHKDGGDSFHAAEPEKVTTKVRTTKDFGKMPFDQFDIYKEQ